MIGDGINFRLGLDKPSRRIPQLWDIVGDYSSETDRVYTIKLVGRDLNHMLEMSSLPSILNRTPVCSID